MPGRSEEKVLVTGVTGYVGGHLVPRLLEAGYQVRALVRDPARLGGRSWEGRIGIAQGDVLQPETLPPALKDIHSAYYLIHSMSGNPDFHQRDVRAAINFSRAARAAGVRRIIYLGGLGDPEADLSQHLRSRQETGQALRQAGVPVTELRAAIIVGSGSVSFEMIRYLTERVPVMICPQWVYTRVQPIAIRDVLGYLIGALVQPDRTNQILEIGGTDVLTYGEMMLGYARIRGLRRVLLPVPVLTPRLSSYWVHWVTPITATISQPLIQGLRNEVIVRDDTARRQFPDIQPLDYETAVRLALTRLSAIDIESQWTEPLTSSQVDETPVSLTTQEGMIIERRMRLVNASPGEVYRVFSRLGGSEGWLYANWLWVIRGLLDRIIGGVGFRRGRRDPQEVRVSDAIDFWRVEAVQPGHSLLLRAEMKLPGSAWLSFESRPQTNRGSRFVQTAFFAPKGLFGFLYWYALYPVHRLIFAGLNREIARRAQAGQPQERAAPVEDP